MGSWLKDLKAKCNENIVIILIGNKLDVVQKDPTQRKVTKEIAASYAANHLIPYVETSAVEGTNVSEAFVMVINEVYRVLKKNGDVERTLNTSDPTGRYRTLNKNMQI